MEYRKRIARFELTISLAAATGLVARVFPARLVFTSDMRQIGYFFLSSKFYLCFLVLIWQQLGGSAGNC